MRTYITVIIPPSIYPTEWHSGTRTLSRGAFKNRLEAFRWAKVNLRERPFTLRLVEW